MLLWIILVIAAAVSMMLGIELLMARLGIRPVDPDQRSGGFRDVIEKGREWSEARRADRQDRQKS